MCVCVNLAKTHILLYTIAIISTFVGLTNDLRCSLIGFYPHTHTYIRTNAHIYIYISIYMCVFVRMYVCVCVCVPKTLK